MSVITVELQYHSETGNYLIGLDPSGEKRWFDKRKHETLEVRGGRLFVSLREKDWKKRCKTETVTKPIADSERRHRKCLTCKEPFHAERFIFICMPCKDTPEWRDGCSMFDPL